MVGLHKWTRHTRTWILWGRPARHHDLLWSRDHSSSKRWFYVDTDTLPTNKATLQVGFVRDAERARVEVPNPKYRPEAK